MHGKLEMAKAMLDGAVKVAVLTGAGISAESGVPTFRDAAGSLWRNQRPEDLATPEAFHRDPETVWEFYNERREHLRSCKPNPAHYALAELEQFIPEFTLVTQNVDELHRVAGSRSVLEMHGSIWSIRCTVCGHEYGDRTRLEPMPLCPLCRGLMRPGVVWFGEQLPQDVLAKSIEAIAGSQVMMVIGTSGVVQPAASFAQMAKQSGAVVLEINLEPTPNTDLVDLAMQGRAGEILPTLVRAVTENEA